MIKMITLFALGTFSLVACNSDSDSDNQDSGPAPGDSALPLEDGAISTEDSTLSEDSGPALGDSTVEDALLPDAAPPEGICSEPDYPPCEDNMILEMALQDRAALGMIENDSSDAEQGAWLSVVDARAGGFNANPPDSYTYARFGEDGLERVAISDEDSLESMDWDIAFRRFVIRLNGGDSGPSCVAAWTAPAGSKFEGLSAEDAGAFQMDDFYGGSCQFIDDGSGLETTPNTALASYYHYDGCVKMTERVYILRLADARLLKLQILAYYFPIENQQQCEEGGGMVGGGAQFSVHWAFL